MLLERLLAVVRPEFRGDVLVFDVDDPVFGGGVCRVRNCRRPARGHGLCQGHHLRWVGEGRPEVDVFAASTDPRWRRQRPNAACGLAGCGYGVARSGLCQLHYQRWDRASRPDRAGWSADQPTITPPQPGATCRVEGCQLWPQAAGPFCHSHAATWRRRGRPDLEAFARTFAEVAAHRRADRAARPARPAPQARAAVRPAVPS